MQNKPIVSVAMTTFNGETYIVDQLESLANQTYRDIEIIIVDDCSTDKTIEILNSYKNVSNIKIFQNKTNLGFKRNFEKAISLCQGDYIALCDQDDIWHLDKIEILINNLGGYALIHTDATVIDEFGEMIDPSWTTYYPKKKDSDIYDYINMKNNVTGCTCMFTSFLQKTLLPIPESIPFHDWWIAMIAFNNGGIKYFDWPLMKYRLHSGNTIGKKKLQTTQNPRINNIKFHLTLLKNKKKIQLNIGECKYIVKKIAISFYYFIISQFIGKIT